MDALHQALCDRLTGEELIDYLLEAAPVLLERERCPKRRKLIEAEFVRSRCGLPVFSAHRMCRCGGFLQVADCKFGTDTREICRDCGSVFRLMAECATFQTGGRLCARRRRRHAYVRLTRWKDFLRQLQGTTNNMIASRDLDRVQKAYKRWGWDRVTVPRTLFLFKRLRLTKYNDRVRQFASALDPTIVHPTLTYEEAARATALFKNIDAAWERVSNKRKNFMSYSYVAYRIFEEMGVTRVLPHIRMLKDKTLVRKLDAYWRQIEHER